MEATEKRETENASGRMSRVLNSASKFLLLLAGYFLLQVILRLITSATTDLDESEQVLATQQLQWGYGPQPPLYTWMLYPLMHSFARGVLAIAILKDALLFGLYAVTYANARFIFNDRLRCAVAALSLLFLPQIAWESQRDLSHSVLVTFMAALTFLVFLKLMRRQQWHLYAALGLCLGAGVLAKYSFLIFAVGLLIGALTVRSTRNVVLHPGMLLALVVGAAVTLPHFLWASHHVDWVMASSSKLKVAADRPWLRTTLAGTGNLLTSIASHLAPIVLICGIVSLWPRSESRGQSPMPDAARVIRNALLAMFGLLLAGVLFFKVTGFKDRWLMPLCVWVPLYLIAVFSGRLSVSRLKLLAGLAISVALIVAALIPLRVRFAKTFGFAQILNRPCTALAKQLPEQAVRHPIIIAGDNWVGGNLKVIFPDKFVTSPAIYLEHPITNGAEAFLIWDSGKEAVRDKLFSLVSRIGEVRTNEIQYVESSLNFWPEKTCGFGFTSLRIATNGSLAFPHANLPKE